MQLMANMAAGGGLQPVWAACFPEALSALATQVIGVT